MIGVSEGPIKGPINGPSSIYADSTALQDVNGNPAFSNFTLDFWQGQPTGDQVTMTLGGFASPIHINSPQNLAKNVPVTVQGIQTAINAVDFRIVINQLFKQDSKGVYTEPLQLKFEYKKTTDSAWSPCFTGSGGTPTNGPINSGNRNWVSDYAFVADGDNYSFDGDRTLYAISYTPTVAPVDTNTLQLDVANNKAYHWDTGSQVWVQALMTAGSGSAYATFTDSDINSTVRRVYRPASTPPTDARVGDIWETQTSPASFLMWNGAAWVSPGQYGNYGPDPQSLTNGVWSINDKVSSTTGVTIRCFVPSYSGTYQYRLTKLTTDTTLTEFVNVIWETLEEIKQTPLSFTNLSMLKVLGQASDQFTAIPNLSGDYLGRLVKIPNNYDPVARTYSGVWDGTYKIDYTNNTAFIFQDFVENTNYGLSSVYPHSVDKWAIYNWAQNCDALVLKADGTYQPRWTYNDYIQQPRDAKEMAQYIASSAAAISVDDGNGTITVLYDDPSASAVALFTPENVTPEGFNYSYTDVMTRTNETFVSFTNPDLNWSVDKRRISDETNIAANGRVTDNFIATGCIDVDEAMRRARRRQITSLTEKEFVNFTTNRKGLYLNSWNIILVSDPDMGRGLPGRIHSQSGNTVTLRDPVTLESGLSYLAFFDTGLQTSAYPITTSAGTTTSLTFSGTVPTLPEYAVFSIQCDGMVGSPKPYRVISTDDNSGSGDIIQITALELNRNKQAYIDGAAAASTLYSSSFDTDSVQPPQNLKLGVAYQYVGSGASRTLTLSWDPAPSEFTKAYHVVYTVDGTVVSDVTTSDLTIDVHNANRGQYLFYVSAINQKGKESNSAQYGFDVAGQARPVNPPQNLHLVGGVTSTTFDTADVTVAFDDANPNPNFNSYSLTIGNRVVNLGSAKTYTYKFADQKADNGGTASRTLAVSAVSIDQDGNVSAPTTLSISNPAPSAPTFTLEAVSGGFNVNVVPSSERDVVGTKVWVGATGFNPATTTPVRDADQTSFFIPSTATAGQYVRVAFYDNYSSSGLNVAAEQSVTPQGLPWTSVVGSTKPADNATAGATWGTNLANRPNWSTDVMTQPDGFTSGPVLKADYVWHQDGVRQLSTYMPAGTNADQTATHVAPAVVNQSEWATTSVSVARVMTPRPNMVQNSNFAQGLQYWTDYGTGGGSFVSAASGQGLSARSTATGTSTVARLGQAILVYPNLNYTLTFQSQDDQPAGSTGGTYYIEWLDASRSHVGYSAFSVVTTGVGMQAYTLTALSPSTSQYALVSFDTYGRSGTAGAYAIYFRNFKLELGSVASLYTQDITSGASQFIDTTGRVVDARGLPINANVACAYTYNPSTPCSGATTTSITMTACTVTAAGGYVYSVPSATVTGLSANTTYAMFYDFQTNAYVAISSGSTAYFTNPSRYLFMTNALTSASGTGTGGGSSGGGGGGSTCPAPETRILTTDGWVAAGDLQVGDIVRTYHELNLQPCEAKVTVVERHQNKRRLKVTISGVEIVCSEEHRFAISDDWVAASALKVGDVAWGLCPATVEKVEPWTDGDVILITVEDAHTYITEGILSHNTKVTP